MIFLCFNCKPYLLFLSPTAPYCIYPREVDIRLQTGIGKDATLNAELKNSVQSGDVFNISLVADDGKAIFLESLSLATNSIYNLTVCIESEPVAIPGLDFGLPEAEPIICKQVPLQPLLRPVPEGCIHQELFCGTQSWTIRCAHLTLYLQFGANFKTKSLFI